MTSHTIQKAAAPILALYRAILKVHKSKLPRPMQEMGNRYVKEEFSSHLKGNTTQHQWKIFVEEWQRYRDMLLQAPPPPQVASEFEPRDNNCGDTVNEMQSHTPLTTGIDQRGEITKEVIREMTPDQLDRLKRVREEAVKFGREVFK